MHTKGKGEGNKCFYLCYLSVCCSPVMFEEHVRKILEQVWIFGAEISTCDLVHHLFQLWELLVVRHGIISDKG